MNKALTTILALTAMLAAGCSDGVVAPKDNVVGTTQDNVWGGGSLATLTQTDTARFSFLIDPYSTKVYPLGVGNWITFPAGSLCDPSSSYGSTEWDKPCRLASSSLTVNTKAWLDAHGNAHVDFDKSIRFMPTLSPTGWVMLSLTDYGAATTPWETIMYCSTPTHCVDEAKTDPTVATIKNPVTGQLTRRVKHFSGYSITTGDDNSMSVMNAAPAVKPSVKP